MPDIQPGSIKIEQILFTNFNQTETVDIQFIVHEFEVIEYLASPIVRATLVVHDTLSLFTRLPIIGLEPVVITFTVESADVQQYAHQTFSHEFVVTGLKHLHSTTTRSEIFILELASPQIVPARSRRVVKSFQDTPVEEMIKGICEEILNIPSGRLFLESTGIPRDFVCPNLPPFETINILASEAKSGLIPSNYIFYADRDAWHFVTLEKLKTGAREVPLPVIMNTVTGQEVNSGGQGEVEPDIASPGFKFLERVIDEEYFFREHNTPEDDSSETPKTDASSFGIDDGTSLVFRGGKKPFFMRKIIDYRIPTVFDIERGLMMGLFDNSIMVVDPWSEIFKTHQFNYYKDFDQFSHIYEKNKHRIIPDNSQLKFNVGESHQRVIITDKYTAEQDTQMRPRMRQDYIMHRISSIAQMDQMTLHLVIPGDPDRKPGNTIKVRIPEFGATEDILKENNKYLSGMYLITSVKHKYNRNVGYYCHMACVKDCYEELIQDTPGKFPSPSSGGIGPQPTGTSIPGVLEASLLGDPTRWQDFGLSV